MNSIQVSDQIPNPVTLSVPTVTPIQQNVILQTNPELHSFFNHVLTRSFSFDGKESLTIRQWVLLSLVDLEKYCPKDEKTKFLLILGHILSADQTTPEFQEVDQFYYKNDIEDDLKLLDNMLSNAGADRTKVMCLKLLLKKTNILWECTISEILERPFTTIAPEHRKLLTDAHIKLMNILLDGIETGLAKQEQIVEDQTAIWQRESKGVTRTHVHGKARPKTLIATPGSYNEEDKRYSGYVRRMDSAQIAINACYKDFKYNAKKVLENLSDDDEITASEGSEFYKVKLTFKMLDRVLQTRGNNIKGGAPSKEGSNASVLCSPVKQCLAEYDEMDKDPTIHIRGEGLRNPKILVSNLYGKSRYLLQLYERNITNDDYRLLLKSTYVNVSRYMWQFYSDYHVFVYDENSQITQSLTSGAMSFGYSGPRDVTPKMKEDYERGMQMIKEFRNLIEMVAGEGGYARYIDAQILTTNFMFAGNLVMSMICNYFSGLPTDDLTTSESQTWAPFEVWEDGIEVKSKRKPKVPKSTFKKIAKSSPILEPKDEEEVKPSAVQEMPVLSPIQSFLSNLQHDSGKSSIDIFDDSTRLLLDMVPKRWIDTQELDAQDLSIVERAQKEAISHIFMASCGIRESLTRLAKGDWASVLSTFPMVMLDLHIILEQQVNGMIVENDGELPVTHSLKKLYQDAGLWQKLTAEEQQHIQQFNQALIWSRYPVSSFSKCEISNIPEALKQFTDIIDIAKGECGLGAKRTLENKQERAKQLVSYVLQSYYMTLKLFIEHQTNVNLKIKNDLLSLVELYNPNGIVAKKLESELISISTSKEQPFELSQDVKAKLNKLITAKTNLPLTDDRVALFGTLGDMEQHLIRLAVSIKNANENTIPHMRSWHTRNMMNIQWIIEQLYIAKLAVKNHEVLYLHDFKVLQSLIGPYLATQKTSTDVSDVDTAAYNFQTFHYSHRREQDPLFKSFNEEMMADQNAVGIDKEFVRIASTKRSEKKKSGKSSDTLLQSQIENAQNGLTTAFLMLDHLIKSQKWEISSQTMIRV